MEQEDDDQSSFVAIHSEEYYLNLVKSLNRNDFIPRFRKKSILDDDASSPYKYIQINRGIIGRPATRGTDKSKSDIRFEREVKKLDILCLKEAQNQEQNNSLAKETRKIMRTLEPGRQSMQEKRLDRGILQPLRDNPYQLQYLVNKVQKHLKEHRQPIVERELHVTSPEEKQRRHTAVHSRRAAMEMIRTLQLNSQAETDYATQNNHSHSMVSPRRGGARVEVWLRFLFLQLYLKKFGERVREIRERKDANRIQWQAAMKIQKMWRIAHKKYRRLSLTARIRKASMSNDQTLTFQKRNQAANLIMTFLKDTSIQASFRKLIRRVRLIQRTYRCYKAVTDARIHLLSRLLDHLTPSLSFHINIVLSHKGLDLKNLPPLESAQIRQYLQNPRTHRISRLMATPAFHAFVRSHANRCESFHRDFVAGGGLRGMGGASEGLAFAKRRILKKYLLGLRTSFLKALQEPPPLAVDTRVVTLEEAREFIRAGGSDKDKIHKDTSESDVLMHFMKEQEEKIRQYYEQRLVPKTPFRPSRPTSAAPLPSPRAISTPYAPPSNPTHRAPLVTSPSPSSSVVLASTPFSPRSSFLLSPRSSAPVTPQRRTSMAIPAGSTSNEAEAASDHPWALAAPAAVTEPPDNPPFVLPRLLLLGMVTPQDVLSLFWEIAEVLRGSRQPHPNTRTTSTSSALGGAGGSASSFAGPGEFASSSRPSGEEAGGWDGLVGGVGTSSSSVAQVSDRRSSRKAGAAGGGRRSSMSHQPHPPSSGRRSSVTASANAGRRASRQLSSSINLSGSRFN